MAVNDTLTIGAITALRQRGFRGQDNVVTAGFDDHPKAVITTFPLTTAHQPFYDMGRQAVNLILRRLRGEEMPAVVEVPAPFAGRSGRGHHRGAGTRLGIL